MSSLTGVHTKMDPKFEVVTMVSRRAQKLQSAAPSQLAFYFPVVVKCVVQVLVSNRLPMSRS